MNIGSFLTAVVILLSGIVGGAKTTVQSCGVHDYGNASLRQVIAATCESTKSSSECQSLYQDMTHRKIDVKSRALDCADKNLLLKSVEDLSNFRNGCASGGWTFVKDSFISVGTFIGESAAKAKIAYDTEKQENALCDADAQGVQKLYEQHNKFSVKALQVSIPSKTEQLKMSCFVAKINIKSAVATKAAAISASIATKTAKKQALNAVEKEFQSYHLKNIGLPKIDLQEKAKQYLKEQGIKLQCYNAQARAEMICEAIAEVASTSVGGIGAVSKSVKAAKIAEMGGVPQVAVKANGRLQAIAKTPATVAELSRAAKLSNADRVASAEGLLGRRLSSDQKKALIDAHEVAQDTGRGFGSYTTADLSQKARILESNGFSKTEREALMRRGLAGQETNFEVVRKSANTHRLAAEKARSGNDLNAATELYKQSAQNMDIYLKNPSSRKSSRDYAEASYVNAAAGNYDKAAKYLIDRYNLEYGDVREPARRFEMIYEAMRRSKEDLRKGVNSDPRNINRRKYYEDEQKLIDAVIKNGTIKFTPSHIKELRR